MRREQLIEALQVRPFRPFRLYVSDGGTLDVRHPEMLMVKHRSAVIGLLENGNNGNQEEVYPRIERSTEVDLAQVTRIEELPQLR